MTSHCPARDAHEILAGIGGASPSVSTLQRVTRSMNADLEALPSGRRTRIRSAEDIPADARSSSVSLDGVMVPLTKGEDGRSGGSWREASCGAVSFQDAQGQRRKTVYFGCMPEAGKATLKAEIEREVARIRELAFFRKNRRRMRYAALAYQAMGIGSGIVEAANKVLVAQRMNWRIASGQAVLPFRVLQKSGLFDLTWSDLMAARDAAASDNHPLPDRALAA